MSANLKKSYVYYYVIKVRLEPETDILVLKVNYDIFETFILVLNVPKIKTIKKSKGVNSLSMAL